jgi:hypothetical protein
LINLFSEYDKLIIFEAASETKEFIQKNDLDAAFIYISGIRFAEDVLFSLEATDVGSHNKIVNSSVSIPNVKILAKYWQQRVLENSNSVDIPPGTALVIGQVEKDMSVWDGEKMLSLDDYQNEIKEICEKYKHVLYKSHPLNEGRESSFIKSGPNVDETTASVYELLPSKNLSAVFALSSSVVEEAIAFGKEGYYLFQSLFNANANHGLIGAGIMNSDFLNYVFDVEGDKLFQKEYLSIPRLRDIRGIYWGYKDLLEVGRPSLPSEVKLKEELFKLTKSTQDSLNSIDISHNRIEELSEKLIKIEQYLCRPSFIKRLGNAIRKRWYKICP